MLYPGRPEPHWSPPSNLSRTNNIHTYFRSAEHPLTFHRVLLGELFIHWPRFCMWHGPRLRFESLGPRSRSKSFNPTCNSEAPTSFPVQQPVCDWISRIERVTEQRRGMVTVVWLMCGLTKTKSPHRENHNHLMHNW